MVTGVFFHMSLQLDDHEKKSKKNTFLVLKYICYNAQVLEPRVRGI